MKPWWWLVFVLAGVALGQERLGASDPFTLTWTEGKCVGCKTAGALGRIQFVSRSEGWAVGYFLPPPDAQGASDYIVVRTVDGGRTWRELSQTYEHGGDGDGPPAFWFLDAARGWIAWWNPADDPKTIRTRDGGRHWQEVSQEILHKVRFFDDKHGYGVARATFLRTNDGGRSWTKAQIPRLSFINRMFFLTPDLGWIAGTDEKDFLVFRTVDGGLHWDESQIPGRNEVAEVRDLFFLDQNRGWLIAWHSNDAGMYLHSTADGGKSWAPDPALSFPGRNKWAGVVRFLSPRNGFVFLTGENDRNSLMYTADGGAHWRERSLPHFVCDCQVFERDLVCSAGFRLLTLHVK